MKTLLLISALLAGLFDSLATVPVPPAPALYNPFCRTEWLFTAHCPKISSIILQQIQAFNPSKGCDECQYMLVSATFQSIKASHTSLDGLQTQNITLTFTPTMMTGGCRVSAQSTSLEFSNLLDDDVNYCNLHNLVSASGLTSAPGYMEMTNEWVCLSYRLATCTT